jgi:hypothetical protein
MPKRRNYLVDANVLMEAKRRYYRFDLCPGFWACLAWQHKQGSIGSIDRVRVEIEEGKDDLAHWAKRTCPKTFFSATTDAKVAAAYGKIIAWVQSQVRYSPAAKAEFAQVADGWLIAYSNVHNLIVVTHEAPAPESRKEVKIPDVCNQFSVPYVDTFDMLEALGTEFIWKPPT